MFEPGSGPSYLGLAAVNNRAAHAHANSAAYWEGLANRWMSHSREQDARIATLEEDVMLKSAALAGCLAQGKALIADHPTSILLGPSGGTYKTGKTKTKLRVIYEVAFDSVLSSLGIANPADRRTN